jgi:hypothetical protein
VLPSRPALRPAVAAIPSLLCHRRAVFPPPGNLAGLRLRRPPDLGRHRPLPDLGLRLRDLCRAVRRQSLSAAASFNDPPSARGGSPSFNGRRQGQRSAPGAARPQPPGAGRRLPSARSLPGAEIRALSAAWGRASFSARGRAPFSARGRDLAVLCRKSAPSAAVADRAANLQHRCSR